MITSLATEIGRQCIILFESILHFVQVTDVFLNGHSNSLVHIIGCKMTPVLEHLDSFGPQETPLRYSPLMGVADQQSV